MKELSAVFIFCEGNHDVAFVSKVLKIIDGFEEFKNKISDLPYPIQKYYLNKHVEYEPFADIEKVSAPFMPKSVLLDSNENLYFLYPSGGLEKIMLWKKPKSDHIPEEIKKIKESINYEIDKIEEAIELDLPVNYHYMGETTEVKEYIRNLKFAFIIDADDSTSNERFEEFKENYINYFGKNSFNSSKPNEWDITNGIGIFIFCRVEDQKGSLEDLSTKVIKEDKKDSLNDMYSHFKKIFSQKNNNQKQLSVIEIRRNKATLCSTGQEIYYGSSLAVILYDEKNKFLDENKIKENEQCKQISEFFKKAIG